MSRLSEFLQDVQSRGDDQMSTLKNIVAMMDETLQLFDKHTKKCNMEVLDFPKNRVAGCDCGADTVKELYEEIELLLEEEYPEQ